MQMKNCVIFAQVIYFKHLLLPTWFQSPVIIRRFYSFVGVTDKAPDQAAVPYLCRQVAAHSTVMGVQGHTEERVHPGADGHSSRSSADSLQPGSGACWSWGSHRWGSLGDCRAHRSQLDVNGREGSRRLRRKCGSLQGRSCCLSVTK